MPLFDPVIAVNVKILYRELRLTRGILLILFNCLKNMENGMQFAIFIEIKSPEMKKFVLSLVAVLCNVFVFAQEQQLSPKATAKGTNIEVSYGQPSKRDRVIFGDVVPYNEVWRAGANEATEVTFKKDVDFAGKSIKAGTYTLFAIPGEKEWTIILNSALGIWGTEYEQAKSSNVAEVKVPVHKLNSVQEKLTYTVNNGQLSIEWDKTGVDIPLKF